MVVILVRAVNFRRMGETLLQHLDDGCGVFFGHFDTDAFDGGAKNLLLNFGYMHGLFYRGVEVFAQQIQFVWCQAIFGRS